MNAAEALVQMLIDYRVEYIFGVPGDTNVPLYHAIRDAGGRIRHVLARDERSAAYMADAYARLTGKPGVCECPSGAGVLYSIPGVAEANSSSVPLILLINDIPLAGEGRATLTELDCVRLFEPVTKLSVQVKAADKLPETVRRAFRAATSGKPGAVQITLPEDVMVEPVSPSMSLRVEPDARPVGLFGDGSFGMAAGELETLVRLRVPAVLIHFNNACFGWIKALQRVHARPGANEAFVSVDFNPGDMRRVAEAFGVTAFRAQTPDELEIALDAAFATKDPSFVDVAVESIGDVIPPVYRWLQKTGKDPLAVAAAE